MDGAWVALERRRLAARQAARARFAAGVELSPHRKSREDLFDPGVFSATADRFHDQIAYVKRRLSPVTLDEAMAFLTGADEKKPNAAVC